MLPAIAACSAGDNPAIGCPFSRIYEQKTSFTYVVFDVRRADERGRLHLSWRAAGAVGRLLADALLGARYCFREFMALLQGISAALCLDMRLV